MMITNKIVSLHRIIIFFMSLYVKQTELIGSLQSYVSKNKSIGFVPTMGALHKGHLSLMEASLKNNDLTIVSVFVNPTQFNNPEDLKKYPRTIEADVEKIAALNKNIIVYAPEVSDLYSEKVEAKSFNYDGLEFQMEGKHRPGHFDGVGTIVKKLFEIIKPTTAYFGEKDFQQVCIIKKLVEKYQIPVNIIMCPIFRETNGLAMSSRNERLSEIERKKAALIFETITKAKILFKTKSALQVQNWVKKTFEKQQLFELEYFEIADEKTLMACVRKSKQKKYRSFIAVFVNNIRLIDTISLN
jgi:pantoate--beta-alanine ligase